MEAKVNEQTNNDNMSANNKQTNKGGAHAGVVWNCAVTESSAQCIRVRGKASEMYRRYTGRLRRYRRYIGKGTKVGRRSYSDTNMKCWGVVEWVRKHPHIKEGGEAGPSIECCKHCIVKGKVFFLAVVRV